MAYQYRNEITARWAYRLRHCGNRDALGLAYLMGDTLPYGDLIWHGGRLNSAIALGMIVPGQGVTPTAAQALRRARVGLEQEGFLTVVERPRAGAATTYRLNLGD